MAEENARGRIDHDGQQAVIKMESLQTKISHLIDLLEKSQNAAKDYSDAVKAVAEESGLLAASVTKYVKAKAGENFEDVRAKVAQMSLVFEEAE